MNRFSCTFWRCFWISWSSRSAKSMLICLSVKILSKLFHMRDSFSLITRFRAFRITEKAKPRPMVSSTSRISRPVFRLPAISLIICAENQMVTKGERASAAAAITLVRISFGQYSASMR